MNNNNDEQYNDADDSMTGGVKRRVFREMSFVDYMTTITTNEKSQILNMVQYGGLSILPIMLVLKLMKQYIPMEDPYKSTTEILIEVVLQLIIVLVAFFFIHRLILYIPTYSNMEYEKVNLLTIVLPLFFLMFTLDTKISEKLNILLDRLLMFVGLKKEGMEGDENEEEKPEQASPMDDRILGGGTTTRGEVDSMMPHGGGGGGHSHGSGGGGSHSHGGGGGSPMMESFEPQPSNAGGYSPF